MSLYDNTCVNCSTSLSETNISREKGCEFANRVASGKSETLDCHTPWNLVTQVTTWSFALVPHGSFVNSTLTAHRSMLDMVSPDPEYSSVRPVHTAGTATADKQEN